MSSHLRPKVPYACDAPARRSRWPRIISWIPILALLSLMLTVGAGRANQASALKYVRFETSSELAIANHVRFGSRLEEVMRLVPKGAWLGQGARGLSLPELRLHQRGQHIYLKWGRHTFRGYFVNGRLVYGNESVFMQFKPPATLWDGADVCVPGTQPPLDSPEFNPTIYWVGGDKYDSMGKPYVE